MDLIDTMDLEQIILQTEYELELSKIEVKYNERRLELLKKQLKKDKLTNIGFEKSKDKKNK